MVPQAFRWPLFGDYAKNGQVKNKMLGRVAGIKTASKQSRDSSG